MTRLAMYAGSFDPFHAGHRNIVEKAAELFDKLYVVVTKNINKDARADINERADLVISSLKDLNNVEVLVNVDRLTSDLARELDVKYLVRGLRNAKDLAYEFELADANHFEYKELETIFFISDKNDRQISSTMIHEMNLYKSKESGNK